MYVSPNFPTKKALKEALAAGKTVSCFQPNNMFGASAEPRDGAVTVEGPHYPKPHTWYARVMLRDGVVVKVLS